MNTLRAVLFMTAFAALIGGLLGWSTEVRLWALLTFAIAGVAFVALGEGTIVTHCRSNAWC
jgi:hypothetical protein